MNSKKWKAVPLTGNLQDLEAEGLICFEELTDYQLPGDKKRKKRSTQDDWEVVETKKAKRAKGEEKAKPSQSKKKKEKVKKEIPPKTTKPRERFSQSKPNEEKNDTDMSAWVRLNVPDPILQALGDMKFNQPTEIQMKVIPAATKKKVDVMGAAETGSGKTLAFAIPIVYHILQDRKKERKGKQQMEPEEVTEDSSLRALILSPTRELAIQIKNHIAAILKYTDIKVCVLVGGMSTQKQERLLKKCPEIVIATPGRLHQLYKEENPHLQKIPSVNYLVVDEADRMLEGGHFQEFIDLLDVINSHEQDVGKSCRQNYVMSATLLFTHDLPKRLKLEKNPTIFTKKTKDDKLKNMVRQIGLKPNHLLVDVTVKLGISKTLTEAKILCDTSMKDYYLYYILEKYPGRTIVFCNSISCIRRLGGLLSVLQKNPSTLHASKQQKQRLKSIEKFMADESGLLLATDVAARGLDLPNIQHVIHYQVPRTTELYVHRSGRTARASKEGVSILLVDSSEILNYRKICTNVDKDYDLPTFPVQDSDLHRVKTIVDIGRDIDFTEHWIQKREFEKNWVRTNAKKMELEIDEDDIAADVGADEERAQRTRYVKACQAKLKELKACSAMPSFSNRRYPTKSIAVKKSTIQQQPSGGKTTAVEVVKKRKVQEDQLLKEILKNKKQLEFIRHRQKQKRKQKRNQQAKK